MHGDIKSLFSVMFAFGTMVLYSKALQYINVDPQQLRAACAVMYLYKMRQ